LKGEEKEINVDIPAPLINKDNVQEYIDYYKSRGMIK
jgi:hypothetical protein